MYVKKENKVVPILYFSIAGLAFIFSIICFTMSTDLPWWSYSFNEYYGGDAYTGIQNVGVDISDNVIEVGYLLRDFAGMSTTSVGFILMIVACVLVTLGIKGILPVKYEKVEETKKVDTATSVQSEN